MSGSSGTGAAPTTGGAPSTGGVSGGSGSGGAGTGGAPGGTGGAPGGSGGAPGGSGGAGGGTIPPHMLDCGPQGVPLESAGPPQNRVNYVIVAEGYLESEQELFIEHVRGTLERRFDHETGEPFGRYRKFVNICAIKAVSQEHVGTQAGNTPFGGYYIQSDRVSRINEQSVNSYLDENLPMELEPDWRAASFNITGWYNVGGGVMLFAGGHNDAAGAALHEGGHSHHQLADEYGTCTGRGCGDDTDGTGSTGQEYGEINSTGNPMTTGGKWDRWIGFVQKGLKVPDEGATGIQSTFSGSRYVSPTSGQYRPSDNSMMNSLFGMELDTSFNAISREQIIYTIWREVTPIDATEPPAGAVTGAVALQVFVVDPAVIDVDWSVNGMVVAAKGGTSFDLATRGLAAGTYTVSAKAYDNATEDLVRYREGTCPSTVTQRYCHSPAWLNSTETVEWTVTIP